MDSSNGYSVPLPPSLPSNGSLPARRLQTQAPVSEPPACVQNAMMTKDKKPFTYTPGGIDLSQIKSPRMAKRIARNAQYEGITNQPKPSPLAQEQYNSMSGNSPPAAPPPPASAMGMPVQVFPTGPPPPPPAPSSSATNNSNIPPPPPPMSSAQLTPQSNGRDTRKSPTPQNFEPPPLGCRPEIKIPPNPMATLRKVPKPEPKNDFWIEEYRKERSKSPMAGEQTTGEQSANQPVRQEAPPTVSSPIPTTTATANNLENDSDPRKDPNRIAFQQQQRQQPQQYQPQQYQSQPTYQPQSPRPVQPTYQQQKQTEPSYPPHMDPNRIAFQQQRQQPLQYQQPQRDVSPVRTPVGYQQQSPLQQQRPQPAVMSPNVHHVDSPFRTQAQPNLQRPMSPDKSMNSPTTPQQQPQSPYYMRSSQQQQPQYQQPQQQQPRQYVTSPPPQQKPAQVGSLYIAPVPPENLATGSETPRSAGLQQTPPWLSQRPTLKENPDWVREVNTPPAANRTQTPPINQSQVNNGPGLRLQMNQNVTQSNQKERIIPIQIEKTPTPTRTPSTPGFGPQPYSPNNQYGSVTSPAPGYSSPSGAVRSPNQFVDQGYNNFTNQWQNQQQQQQQVQQRVVSPPVQQQQGGGRIIPVAIERDDGPFNPNVVRGPISPAPMVIQNDPRGGPQSRSPNGMTPNQSKSFRVLQKITDTEIDRDSDSEQPVELHGPQYSKQMGETIDQMRRMQMNDTNLQAFVNRGPNHRQTQRYVQQRPIYQQDDQPQQYVHPSEQQAPEPKIYTGSAIPSRSFKLLQAMTTPENAGPGQSDL